MGANQINKTARKRQDTYIYIDVSNIRSCCIKTSGFLIDFVKLLDYFKRRYPNLKEVRYYEGVAKGDKKKQEMFKFLEKKGYTICSLERKSYTLTETKAVEIKCPKCENEWTAEITEEHLTMKSNVDVYLASDIMMRASVADHPTRVILVSCDGDYAEMIKNALSLNNNISVSVLGTPPVRDIKKNTFSVRLKALRGELPKSRYKLHNIDDIRSVIKSDRQMISK